MTPLADLRAIALRISDLADAMAASDPARVRVLTIELTRFSRSVIQISGPLPEPVFYALLESLVIAVEWSDVA